MPKYRPGSRVAQVYDHFLQHGADSTVTFGQQLKLADGTVKGWLRMWAKEGPASPKRKSPGGERVYDLGSVGRHGTIITKGSEVSEVRWDDGRTQFVTNEYLQPVIKV
jgi:hypothetical protein